MKNLRTIFTAEPDEKIVSAVQYRDRLFIATSWRILEWDAASETFIVMQFAVLHDNPEIVVVRTAEKTKETQPC